MSRRTSRRSGQGEPQNLSNGGGRDGIFGLYEVFRRSTLSSLKPKTLVGGPFDGSHTINHPPSLFTMLPYASMK